MTLVDYTLEFKLLTAVRKWKEGYFFPSVTLLSAPRGSLHHYLPLVSKYLTAADSIQELKLWPGKSRTITKWLRLESVSGDHLTQCPCSEEGQLQWHFEHLQGWNLYSLPGQPNLIFKHPHSHLQESGNHINSWESKALRDKGPGAVWLANLVFKITAESQNSCLRLQAAFSLLYCPLFQEPSPSWAPQPDDFSCLQHTSAFGRPREAVFFVLFFFSIIDSSSGHVF